MHALDTKHGAQRNGVAKDVNENLEASRLAFRKEVITAYLTQEKQHIAHLLRICRDFLDHIKFDKMYVMQVCLKALLYLPLD